MALGPLKAGDAPTLAVVLDQDGKRALFTRTPDGKTKTQKLGESFKSNPTSVAFHDVNQDGLADLVLLIPYEKIKILLQSPGKDFEEVDVAAPGGALEQPWMASLDIDGDGKAELLLPQKNFLRAVVLQADTSSSNAEKSGWTFKVKEQINGAASDSRIAGGLVMPR